jgi:hypothetical protein
MLKIPSAADVTPPLMVPLRTVAEERYADVKLEAISPPKAESERSSPWLLAGGALLVLGLFGAGSLVFLAGKTPAARTLNSPPSVPVALSVTTLEERGDLSLITELKPLAEKFLAATSVDQCLPLIRNPETVAARMRAYYPSGVIPALGMSEFNTRGGLEMLEGMVSAGVRTRDQNEKTMAFVPTGAGFKIDWESWVGWSELSWEKFRETKPVQACRFRVNVYPTEYYNFAFTDDLKWQSYRLDSPDGTHTIYGYVEKGSDLARSLHLDPDTRMSSMILTLKFPPNSDSRDQVEIVQVVTDGWVEK